MLMLDRRMLLRAGSAAVRAAALARTAPASQRAGGPSLASTASSSAPSRSPSSATARSRSRPKTLWGDRAEDEGEGPLCGPGAVPPGSAHGQDDACGLAVEAPFLCRFDGRPHDQPRSRTLHGQAPGRQDHRSESESPVADVPTRRDHPVDPGSRRTARLAGVRLVHGLFADELRRTPDDRSQISESQ
jgi:hypothetical protein